MRALDKWSAIVKTLADAGAFKKQVRDIDLFVKETLEPKATGTLLVRASSMQLFLAWASRCGRKPVPISEEIGLEYLREAVKVSATRGQRFLEAVSFTGYHFSMSVDDLFTPRVRGVALQGLKRKRDTVKRSPLPADVVARLERELVEYGKEEILEQKDLASQIFKGFLLWAVHTRMRFGDATKVALEPRLDIAEEVGFIEAEAKFGRYKTGYDAKKVGRSLPLVGIATGVSREPWAHAWLALRRKAGLDAAADGCLMPEVLSDWQFGAGRMSTSSGRAFLAQVLSDCDITNIEDFGTHSCKATLLSWLAKAGVSKGTRRMLGGHADIRDRSMLEYSRDALAGPLEELAIMLERIAEGCFDPDTTRSGRWRAPPSQKASPSGGGLPPTKPDSATSESSQSSSSPGSASGEEDEDNEEPDVTVEEDHGPRKHKHYVPEFPPGGVVVNLDSRMVHLRGIASITGCGFIFTADKAEELDTWPSGTWRLCRRAGCFPCAERTYDFQ